MRRAGRVVAEMHERIREAIRPGVTLLDLDAIGREVIRQRKARSNFLGYHGYPAVICASRNDVVVHGIPGEQVLEEGDIISIDCGAIVDGYHGDAAFTDIGNASWRTVQALPVRKWTEVVRFAKGNKLEIRIDGTSVTSAIIKE